MGNSTGWNIGESCAEDHDSGDDWNPHGYSDGGEDGGCPCCGRQMCDCSPAERGQTTQGMMDQSYREARQMQDAQAKHKQDKIIARSFIQTDGAEGYRAAAELVGPDMADEFLAELIHNNNPDWNEGTVLIEVQIVRRQKGF